MARAADLAAVVAARHGLTGHGRLSRACAELAAVLIHWDAHGNAAWMPGRRRAAAEESRRFLARMIRNPDVAAHYDSHEVSSFDPWSLLGAVRCPVLVLAGEDDPVCPLPVVEELASRLPADTTRLVRLPEARHTIFLDRPDLAFPAVKTFVAQIGESHPAS